MTTNPGTVLVVEDDEDDVFALTRAIKRAGITQPLQVVTNGQEAIDYLAGTGPFSDRDRFPLPKLVLLDLKMPLINGFGVLSWIRQSGRFEDLRVVVLSGSDEASDHQRAKELGAHSYLVKPASPADLGAVLA